MDENIRNFLSSPLLSEVDKDKCEDVNSEISEDDIINDVNTSDTTEPEDTDDESSTITGTPIGNLELATPPKPKRKTFEELMAENKELKRLTELKNTKITEIRQSNGVILEENQSLSIKLQDIKGQANEQREKLEADRTRLLKSNENLQERIDTMRKGIHDLNQMLFQLITQLKSDLSHGGPSVSGSRSVGLLPRRGQQFSAPSASSPPPPPPQPTVNRPPKNVIQVALEKLNPRITAASAGNPEASSPASNLPRRSQTQKTSITKQIIHCLERIPPPRVPSPRDLAAPAPFCKNAKLKPKDKLLHAVDTTRENEGFYCICGACVTTKMGLITHIKYHTYEGQFRCTVKRCGKRYYTTTSLRSHMKNKHKLKYKGLLGCRTCGATFSTRMELYLHCKNIHKCGPLLAHKRGSNPSSSSAIATCVANAQTVEMIPIKNDSRDRIQKSSGPKSKKDITKYCSGGPTSHGLDTTKANEGDRACFCICGRKFSSKRNLRVHIKYFFTDPKFPCKFCGKLFKGANTLRQHTREKHNMDFSGTGCRTCGQIFQSRVDFTHHCRTAHQNTGPDPVCIENGSPMSEQNQLRIVSSYSLRKTPDKEMSDAGVPPTPSKRQRKIPLKYIEESETYQNRRRRPSKPKIEYLSAGHAPDTTTENDVKCICGSSFTQAAALTRHIRVRAQMTNFKCPYCPRGFPRRDYLKNHLDSTHLTLPRNDNQVTTVAVATKSISSPMNQAKTKTRGPGRPPNSSRHGVASFDPKTRDFKCICGSEFMRPSTLRDHISLKLGLVQYKCELCPEAFLRHDHLKMHLQRIHHSVASGLTCRICGSAGFHTLNEVKAHQSMHHFSSTERNVRDPLLALPWKE